MFQEISESPIIQISHGSDQYNIAENGSCFFGRNMIFKAREDVPNILGTVILASSVRPDMTITVKTANITDFIGKFIDTVNKSDQAKVIVLEEKPDELGDNKPKQLNIGSLEDYQEKTEQIVSSFNDAGTLADTLLNTEFPISMWGSVELRKYMDQIRTAFNTLFQNPEQFETAAEHSNFRIGSTISAIKTKMINKKFVDASVNTVIDNFMVMKKMMVGFIEDFHHLYACDNIFKKSTGYPATWFFDPSVFYNFTGRYEDVCDNLVEACRIEETVMKPLYAWKVKVTGDKHVR